MTVYSATAFFNELNLLEIRLNTLFPYVDYFIISESTTTFSGLSKKLYYLDNQERFLEFKDKIVSSVVTITPKDYKTVLEKYNFFITRNPILAEVYKRIIDSYWFNKNVESYIRNTFEKEYLLLVLSQMNPKEDDIILLGDLDEIPSPHGMEWLLNNFDPEKTYHFKNKMFYYYLNVEKRNEPWAGTLAVSYKKFLENSFSEMRTYKKGVFIEDGGWHFTYMGGPDRVLQKVNSWGEQSLNVPRVTDNIENNMENFLSKKHDLFFRPSEWVVRDINDGTFPEYVVENQDKFSHMIYSQ